VTLDLPTPPLPDEMSSGRVFEPARRRGSRGPRRARGPGPGRRCRPGRRGASAQRLALLVGHHRELEVTSVTPSSVVTAPVTRLVISLRSGHPATVRATRMPTCRRGRPRRCAACRGRRSTGAARGPRRDGGLRRPDRWSGMAMLRWSLWCSTGRPGFALPLRIVEYRRGRPPAHRVRTIDLLSFTATVSAITDAFGDPTRRRSTCTCATHGRHRWRGSRRRGRRRGRVHPNVARHHLDKLAAGGYLEVQTVERPEGRRRRPAVEALPHRRRAGTLRLPGPQRRPRAVAARQGPGALPHRHAEQMAEEVGAEYGRAMAAGCRARSAAGQRSLRSAIQAVADALTAHGFAAHAEARNDQLRIINNHCPFGDVAMEHPVICAVDRGMVRACSPRSTATESSRPAGDTFCTTAF
jgi:predicted ArsR family transcriptional regulator